jgi:hypothetical protein
MRSHEYVLSSSQKYYIINTFLVSFFQCSLCCDCWVLLLTRSCALRKDVLGAALVLSRKPYATIMEDIFDRVLQANDL